MTPPGRLPLIAPHNLTVRFLRNENQFPDSGPLHVALHGAAPDPNLTYTDCLYRLPENFTI